MTKRHENCVSNKVITIGYSQYVSLVSRSMVSCFNLLFFFPMFLRYPLSFSLSRTVNPFLRLATCSPFLIILQAWNGVSHRSPRISREFPRSVNRRELIDHRPNSFSKTFRMEKWRIVSLLALSHSMQRRKDLIWIRFVWKYGVSIFVERIARHSVFDRRLERFGLDSIRSRFFHRVEAWRTHEPWYTLGKYRDILLSIQRGIQSLVSTILLWEERNDCFVFRNEEIFFCNWKLSSTKEFGRIFILEYVYYWRYR